MIIEGSKDYGTGEILMVGDGTTTEGEVRDWLRRNYSIEENDGTIEHSPESELYGMKNPETWTYFPETEQPSTIK